jgi:hypothetical protein
MYHLGQMVEVILEYCPQPRTVACFERSNNEFMILHRLLQIRAKNRRTGRSRSVAGVPTSSARNRTIKPRIAALVA